jgi:hypothetical protein
MRPLRILVTGSRLWVDTETIRDALLKAIDEINPQYGKPILVHGDARGADRIADRQWQQLRHSRPGWLARPEVHPANWEHYGKAAGHIRNAEMVGIGAAICLAFPIGESRGTRGCIRLAEKAGIPVRIYEGPTP